MNEIQNQTRQTPIEIALGIDKDGMTTARKLYEFLKMDNTHYSRWAKTNITENPFAEENVDYWALAIDGERNFNPNPSQDFKLSANFAKKLSMQGKTEKAEQARDYFIAVEDKLKEVAKGMTHNVKQLKITSREMAKITGKTHHIVMKQIHGRIEELEKMGFNRLEFYLDSTYQGANNCVEPYPEFLCTEQGCEDFARCLEPYIRKVFIEEFTDRFERMRNVLDGKPVKKMPKVVCPADVPEKEPQQALLPDKTVQKTKQKLQTDGSIDLNSIENLTELQAKTRYSVGRNNLLKIADEAGAVVRVGIKRLYSRRVLDDYFKRKAE